MDRFVNERTLGRIFLVSLEGQGVDANARFLRRMRPGAIALFANDFSSNCELQTLIGDIGRFYRDELSAEKPLISIDQEGGRVLRNPDIANSPGNMALTAAGDPLLAEYAGSLMGSGLRMHGVDWDLAPVLDVNRDPLNPIIGTRSFGDDVEAVTAMGSAFIRGMRSVGCLTTAKHFPGHGAVGVDSHLDLPVDSRDSAEIMRDALPFRASLAAGVDSVMLSHLSYPSLTGEDLLPAPFSRRIVTDYLKRDMCCTVPVLTDSLSMGAIRKHFRPAESALAAVDAGVDMLALTDRQDALEMFDALLHAGDRTEARVEDALRRVSRLYQPRGEPRHVSDEGLESLVRRSVTRLGPDRRPDDPFSRVWSVYDFDVTVAGRTYRPLERAMDAIGVKWTRGGDGPAIIQLSDENIREHLELSEIVASHAESYCVGIGMPYDSLLVPGIPYYTGYSPDVMSVRACVESLFGLFEPEGKLPVRLQPAAAE